LTAEESSSPALLSTSPSLIPSFTTPSPVPPQQDSDGVFYGGVDDIQASAAQLQAVAYCLLARRQGRQHPIFKRRRPVVPTAAALQLTERKAIARASACKVFAAVRLQAAARGLLARRRLQKMRSPMHEATLAVVDLSIGERNLAWSVDLAWSDGHQQPRRPAVVFRRKHGVFSVGGELQLCGTGDMGAASLLVTGGDALPSAIAFRHRPPRARLRWLLLPLILGGHTRAPLSFRWSPWDPGGYTRAGPASGGCPPYLQESKIKSRSLLQVNKISRDVKGLFLGVRFVSSGGIVSVIVRLQLEDELHVQVGCSVRGVKGLLGLSPLELISRLLRGQVRPLYIMRGDVSI